ncbi:MAG: hypothetical protein F6K24_06275 [Okeania sp. SIO2D1]|nr:hypothetical protein [Okeania sp. SIO2D1]
MVLDISRKEGTGNREQGGIIDNLWVIIDLIFDFWRCLLNTEELTGSEMLSKYKEQQSVERGFSFLKHPMF